MFAPFGGSSGQIYSRQDFSSQSNLYAYALTASCAVITITRLSSANVHLRASHIPPATIPYASLIVKRVSPRRSSQCEQFLIGDLRKSGRWCAQPTGALCKNGSHAPVSARGYAKANKAERIFGGHTQGPLELRRDSMGAGTKTTLIQIFEPTKAALCIVHRFSSGRNPAATSYVEVPICASLLTVCSATVQCAFLQTGQGWSLIP